MNTCRGARLEGFRGALLTALGLVQLVACGGEASHHSDANSGGAAGTGDTAMGGAISGGHASATGGSSSTAGTNASGAGGSGGATAGGGPIGGMTIGGAPTGGTTQVGGTTAGGTSGAGGETATGGAGRTFHCVAQDSTVAAQSIVTCTGGWRHRVSAEACDSQLPRETVLAPSANPSFDRCVRDSDCTEQPHGYCETQNYTQNPLPSNFCYYGCVTDADCPDGALCECGSSVGTCISAACKVDADCGDGLLCATYKSAPGCPSLAYACQTANDACVADRDCPANQSCTVIAEDGARACRSNTCSVGRPFLVQGFARVAPCTTRSDWHADIQPQILQPSPIARQRVAAAWTATAAMEHASIAAFARFALELLSFGAPAQLVAAATQAMADETRHAELSYALASRYAEVAVGPGPLAVQGALDVSNLDDSIVNTFIEGCVGETVAALEAAEALSLARDEAVRAVLTEIARDEARHAQLAWRFLQWALPRASAAIPARLRAVLQRESNVALSAGRREAVELELTNHGVLSADERAQLRRHVLRHVVQPCFEQLIASVATGHDSGAELLPPLPITPMNAARSG